jgi:predicted Fe-S protein YdhL (DUF1289 family)
MIESPYVNICTRDVRSKLCLGYGRCISELTRWAEMSAAKHGRIMGEFPWRLVTGRRSETTRAIG